MELDQIKKVIEKLKKSPLFYFSLGSKELFHSNFFFWLSKDQGGLAILKNIFQCDEFNSLSREKSGEKITKKNGKEKNFSPKADLVGYMEEESLSKKSKPKPIIIIENKVKDIPNEEQLKYLKESFGEDKKYRILSFFKPTFTVPDPFVFISYKEVIDTIKDNLNLINDPYYKGILNDYVEFVENLQEIMDSFQSKGNYDFSIFSNKKLFEVLNEIKLWENYQRIAGETFRFKLQKELRRVLPKTNFSSGFSINNQKATINFEIEIDGIIAGIQIENDQYRRFVFGDIDSVDILRIIERSVWFRSDFKLARKKRGEDERRSYGIYEMKEKGNSYYQYEKFINNKKLTMPFYEIKKKIKSDLSWISVRENQEKLLSTLRNK